MDIFIGFAIGAITVWACMKLVEWDKEECKKKREFEKSKENKKD